MQRLRSGGVEGKYYVITETIYPTGESRTLYSKLCESSDKSLCPPQHNPELIKRILLFEETEEDYKEMMI